jgi:integrase
MNTSISLPTPPHYAIIDRAGKQPSTSLKYKREIDKLIAAGIDPRNREQLATYATGLSNSSRSFLKAALHLLFTDLELDLHASATVDNLAQTQVGLLRIKAMSKTIHVHQPAGTKTHAWLSREQVEQITALPDLSTTRGMRDYIVLAILLGAGIRRSELANLTFDCIRQQPSKNGIRDVLSVLGKGNKRRTIPISAKLAKHLKEWHRITGDGLVVRAINKSNVINGSLSEIGIHNIVRQYGALIDIPALDAHDLRRTYAMLGLNAGVPITQISALLGHSKISVTQQYLNMEIDLDSTISDYIPLSGD